MQRYNSKHWISIQVKYKEFFSFNFKPSRTPRRSCLPCHCFSGILWFFIQTEIAREELWDNRDTIKEVGKGEATNNSERKSDPIARKYFNNGKSQDISYSLQWTRGVSNCHIFTSTAYELRLLLLFCCQAGPINSSGWVSSHKLIRTRSKQASG